MHIIIQCIKRLAHVQKIVHCVLFLLFSQLVATDHHFQAVYDVAMIQVLIFNLYVLIRDSYAAGRYSLSSVQYDSQLTHSMIIL